MSRNRAGTEDQVDFDGDALFTDSYEFWRIGVFLSNEQQSAVGDGLSRQ
jgi:hypothetical protein